MNVAYMAVLDKDEMINSAAVGISFAEKALGPFGFLIPIGVALSTFGEFLVNLLSMNVIFKQSIYSFILSLFPGCAMSIQFGVTRLCFVAGRGKKE